MSKTWTPAEAYQLYMRGFRDGASITAMKHSGMEPYERGYKDGMLARHAACSKFATEVGYVPGILRTP